MTDRAVKKKIEHVATAAKTVAAEARLALTMVKQAHELAMPVVSRQLGRLAPS
jgi:hypothetical protein